MFELGIWQVVVCKDVVAMWYNMLVVDDWWPATNLVEMVESSEQKKGNREHYQRNHIVNVTLMVQESDLVPRNGLGHVLEIHHKQNSVNDHKYAGHLNHCESSLYNLINLSATIQIKASKRLFLILYQNVLVIFPDSRNIDLLA
jgi:hypothetical protein